MPVDKRFAQQNLCPNANLTVEGKGIFSSGHYVVYCRVQRREVDIRTAKMLCNNGKEFTLKNDRPFGEPAYQKCRFCNNLYR